MPNILQTIVAAKQRELARLPQRQITVETLRDAIRQHGPRRDFVAALQHPRAGDVALIAEVKKASPSAGVICPDFDPVRIAQAYETAGATCLSVLTDEPFFQGSLDHLRRIRSAVSLPLLRKDFILDAHQILEAVEAGADAILLIAAILEPERLAQLHALATGAGLAALVEVHDPAELDGALSAGATLIGVNNRDLKTFQVDLSATEQVAAALAARVRAGSLPTDRVLLVAESGIHSRADVERLKRAGARAVLVGEWLLRGADTAARVRELIQP